MTWFAISGLSTTCIGPAQGTHGPYNTEAEAETELARLRDRGLIHATNSVIYALPDDLEETA